MYIFHGCKRLVFSLCMFVFLVPLVEAKTVINISCFQRMKHVDIYVGGNRYIGTRQRYTPLFPPKLTNFETSSLNEFIL
jgi:hypothetical protein